MGTLEPDEHKRQVFQQRLKTKSGEEIVYVDEAGIDNRDDYPDGYCPVGQRLFALKSGKRTLAHQERLLHWGAQRCLHP